MAGNTVELKIGTKVLFYTGQRIHLCLETADVELLVTSGECNIEVISRKSRGSKRERPKTLTNSVEG